VAEISQILNRFRVSSDPLRSERKVELTALVLTIVLVLQVVQGVASLFLNPQPSPIFPSPDSLQVGTLLGVGLVTAQQSNEVRARPVFWSTRRPASEEPKTTAVGVSTKPQPVKKNELDAVKVLGVIGSGESAVVIAVVKGDKKRILLGDKVVGWTLESVHNGEAVFTDSGRSQTLKLTHTK
jgi:hypothetical protein